MAHFGGATKTEAVQLVFRLRAAGIGARLAFARRGRSLKSQMREADRRGGRYVLIAGEAELAQGKVAIRPLQDGEEQTLVALDEIVDWLGRRLAA
ncbi:MAG TPA: His/Gly/Thr/Pro-type tRNA ligase C-terminal domain-containing protein [Promineifilum sp.]|nr:His/Gly/Thr/Pro-type tRNA ligase C-terminal domain-containing protein [Promineifilum sp.]